MYATHRRHFTGMSRVDVPTDVTNPYAEPAMTFIASTPCPVADKHHQALFAPSALRPAKLLHNFRLHKYFRPKLIILGPKYIPLYKITHT